MKEKTISKIMLTKEELKFLGNTVLKDGKLFNSILFDFKEDEIFIITTNGKQLTKISKPNDTKIKNEQYVFESKLFFTLLRKSKQKIITIVFLENGMSVLEFEKNDCYFKKSNHSFSSYENIDTNIDKFKFFEVETEKLKTNLEFLTKINENNNSVYRFVLNELHIYSRYLDSLSEIKLTVPILKAINFNIEVISLNDLAIYNLLKLVNDKHIRFYIKDKKSVVVVKILKPEINITYITMSL